MKKIIAILIITLTLISCTYQTIDIEVTYSNGDKETISLYLNKGENLYIAGDNRCLINDGHKVGPCDIRNFKIVKRVIHKD